MTNELKRQDLPSGLWVVGTPIGNLMDFSPRARQALEEARVILCEDTRRTAKLLAGAGLPVEMRRLERMDAHATPARIRGIVERLSAGETMALVTDAGTPAISDPGAALVAMAADAGIRLTPIPGPSAVSVLLSVCGFEETSFTFRGFFPRTDREREKELIQAAASEVSRVFVWFESPERILKSLENIEKSAEKVKKITVGKELTKRFEKIFSGSVSEVLGQVRREIQEEGTLGEWVFSVQFFDSPPSVGAEDADSSEWVKSLQCLLNVPIPASEAARQVSKFFGVSRKTVYSAALRISEKKVQG